MKERVIYLLICSAMFITGTIMGHICTEASQEPIVKTITEVSTNTVIQRITVPQVITVEVEKEVERIPEMDLSDDDKILIAKIVMAEAGNQDYIGKRLVADVVLNRLNSERWANTVAGVVYHPNQFTHPASYYTDDCLAAVEAECMERLDYDIMYFRAHHFFSGHPQAYQHGDHYFSYE